MSDKEAIWQTDRSLSSLDTSMLTRIVELADLCKQSYFATVNMQVVD